MATRSFQQRRHGREWQHRNRSTVRHDALHLIQAWRGHDHPAVRADRLDPDEDLDLYAGHHGKRSTSGTHIATVPGCVICHDGIPEPVDQFRGGYFVGQEIDISGFDGQPVKGERRTPAHGPSAVPNRGEFLKRDTPGRNWTIHGATIRRGTFLVSAVSYSLQGFDRSQERLS